MKITRAISVIDVLGHIWQPGVGLCSTEMILSDHDVAAITEISRIRFNLGITREDIQIWLDTHAGDFRKITDFSASLEVDGETLDFPWQDEESEIQFSEAPYSEEF